MTPAERFWAKVEKTDTCWLWTAKPNPDGYGLFNLGGCRRAHSVAYEWLVGPIPEGLVLDHLCHNEDLTCPLGPRCRHRRCVNPSHLEPVRRGKNTLRGFGPSAMNARKTQCPKGHPYASEPGGRWCKQCKADRQRYRRAQQRSAA